MKGIANSCLGAVLFLFASYGGGLLQGADREIAQLTYAPEVPPPITRTKPAVVKPNLDASSIMVYIDNWRVYRFWTSMAMCPAIYRSEPSGGP